jgi:hypothetical protein
MVSGRQNNSGWRDQTSGRLIRDVIPNDLMLNTPVKQHMLMVKKQINQSTSINKWLSMLKTHKSI